MKDLLVRNWPTDFPFRPTQVALSLLLFHLKDISQLYQVFPDEILGSGQFGIVYGG